MTTHTYSSLCVHLSSSPPIALSLRQHSIGRWLKANARINHRACQKFGLGTLALRGLLTFILATRTLRGLLTPVRRTLRM
jgi:hypothetical protein